MSETNNVSNILEAPSLDDQPERADQLAAEQGLKPAVNGAQSLLEAVAGGSRPGERSTETRKRGLRRIVGGAAVAAVAMAGPSVVHGIQRAGEHAIDQQRQANVQPLEDYQRTGQTPKGDTVVPAGNYEGTAWDWAQKHASSGNAQELSGQVSDQADMQGDPGVQSNETYVVPTGELNQATLQHLDQK
jgi:hypothetical protein